MRHDIDEPWETSYPTSDPVITEEGIALLYEEYEYLHDPRRWKLPLHRLLPTEQRKHLGTNLISYPLTNAPLSTT